MNLTPKKLRALIFLLIFVLGIVLTTVTLSVQKNATKRHFSTTVAQVVEKGESVPKSSKNASSGEAPKYYSKFINPSTNFISADRQGSTHLAYNEPSKDSTPLKVAPIFQAKSLQDIPDKGVVFLFLYKPDVASSKDYQPVIDQFANDNHNKYQYRVLNTKDTNLNNDELYSFISSNGNDLIASPPNMDDLYAIGIKDKKVYTFITKTDTKFKSFNSQNLMNVGYNLEHLGEDITNKTKDQPTDNPSDSGDSETSSSNTGGQ